MDDSDKPEEEVNNEADEPHEEKLRYDTVPYASRPEKDLYAYREALSTPPAQPPRQAQGVFDAAGAPVAPPVPPFDKKKQRALIAIAAVGCLVLAIIAVWSLQKGPPPPPIVDLGNGNVANSGLSGDFVARWTDKANFVFYVNPLSADDLPGFAAVAANPPRQIEFTIHLKDASGITICEKEIVFPFKAPEGGSAVPTEGPPERTMDGEVISYDRGDRGEIVRIEVKGPMVCPENLYDRIAAWDFTSTYPVRGDQDDWVKNLEKITARQAAAKKAPPGPLYRLLPAPIDGDDVVVGDNPSRGTVETRAGREFSVGQGGLSTRGQGWGFFPAAIHFHCDVKANCTLTRAGASAAISARLMK
jgi:hypothetical protein